MKTVSDVYPSQWLRASDLSGGRRTVTITEAAVEALRSHNGESVHKIVLSFHGKQKRLVLNVTQAREMAALAGTEHFAQWVGHTISLAPTRTPQGQETITLLPAKTEP